MTPERFKEIKARCEAATKGPWKLGEEFGAKLIGTDDTIIVEISTPQILGCSVKPCNSKFIAHARQDLPDCLDEIERLRGELRRFEFIFSNKRSKPFRLLHDIARKALEGTDAPD